MASVASGGGDPPRISSRVVCSCAIGAVAPSRLREGLRLAALARLAVGRPFAAVRRLAGLACLAVGRRFAEGRRFVPVRRLVVLRRFAPVSYGTIVTPLRVSSASPYVASPARWTTDLAVLQKCLLAAVPAAAPPTSQAIERFPNRD